MEKPKDIYAEKLTILKIFELFDNEGPEVDFIKYNILGEGLDHFSVLVRSDFSDEDKKEYIKSLLGVWGKSK